MSTEELDRARVVALVVDRRLSQVAAAERLGLCPRQVRRLVEAFERAGPAGLASRQRGRPSNRQLSHELRAEALRIVRGSYRDFGPTLAREKLFEVHDIAVSVETLRKWMVADGLVAATARTQSCRPFAATA